MNGKVFVFLVGFTRHSPRYQSRSHGITHLRRSDSADLFSSELALIRAWACRIHNFSMFFLERAKFAPRLKAVWPLHSAETVEHVLSRRMRDAIRPPQCFGCSERNFVGSRLTTKGQNVLLTTTRGLISWVEQQVSDRSKLITFVSLPFLLCNVSAHVCH